MQTARVSCPAPSLGETHGPRKGDGPSAPEGSPATQVLASWPSLAYHAVPEVKTGAPGCELASRWQFKKKTKPTPGPLYETTDITYWPD